MDDNRYSKLEEALRSFLNPTLELIEQNAILAEHCYFLIKKFPTHNHALWEDLVHRDWQKISELKLDPNLIANLNLAKQKQDDDYLEYLLHHRPVNKLTLKLTRRQAIVSQAFTNVLNLKNPEEVSAIIYKQLINQYILNNKLQVKNMIKLDPILREVLKLDSSDPRPEIHFYQLHREFNQKYMVDQT